MHTIAGARILNGSSSRRLQMGESIALSHHEKWDGSGYPKGAAEEEIPIAGRIMAVADVFDALLSERPYKKAYTIQDTLEIIREGSGSHFDPRVVEVFFEHRNAFLEIQKKFR